MDASRIVRRIYDNLNWAAVFDMPVLQAPGEVWRRLAALWREPDRVFIGGLHPLLLCRPAGADERAALGVLLARGAPRSAVVRRLALSDEARGRNLDVSWLPCLATLDREAVWSRLRALWRAPDRVFVEGLYRVLLGRPADPEGLACFCTLLAAGAPRPALARRLARTEEGGGLGASWLPRLAALEREIVWRRVRALWRTPASSFVEDLYLVLLGRVADAPGAAGFRALLATGAPRSEVVRRLALSDEAVTAGLDVSWLPRLADLEPGRRRSSLRSLSSRFRRWLAGWKTVRREPTAPDQADRAA